MSDPGAINRPMVLAADDAEDLRTLFAMMLKPRYHTRLVASGTEALCAANEEPRPDLILLDVMMPDLNDYVDFTPDPAVAGCGHARTRPANIGEFV